MLEIGEERIPLYPDTEVDLTRLGYPEGAWDFKVSGLRPLHAEARFILGMRFIQFGYTNFGQASNVTIDADTDTINDVADFCPETDYAAVVDGEGCSIAQLVPCEGPKDSSRRWRNHGEYVSMLARATESFLVKELISHSEGDAIMAEGAQSSCGR